VRQATTERWPVLRTIRAKGSTSRSRFVATVYASRSLAPRPIVRPSVPLMKAGQKRARTNEAGFKAKCAEGKKKEEVY